MKKVFDVFRGRDGHEVELDHFLNLSLNFVMTNLGDRLEVRVNGVGDGVFFKFERVKAKK